MLSSACMLLLSGAFLMLRLGRGGGSFPRPLTREEERGYVERAMAGDMEARNKLIEHNLRLVAHIVKKYYTQPEAAEDLISIGTVGLIKAIDSYSPDRGVRLATYASKCTENAILSQMRFRVLKRAPFEKSTLAGEYSHSFQRTIISCVGLKIVWFVMRRFTTT